MPVFVGTSGNDNLIGSAGSDTIIGLAGDDTLDDGGSGSADTLIGGAGDDTYIVRNAGDSIVENAGEGTDTVRTALTYYQLAVNVENLYFTGTGSFVGLGNAGDNVIVGGAGNDILYGFAGRDYLIGGDGNDWLLGGAGAANTLQGGLGNDTYFIEAVGDSIVEFAGEGTDEVRTALDRFVLPANVENLVYTGTGMFNGSGNAGDNIIVGGNFGNMLFGFEGRDYLIGGDGADTLDGGTGAANTLQGGFGDDTYIVSAVGDSITEFANAGNDTVRTVLGALVLAANVENLVYTGTGSFVGIGNELDNVITGGTGRDELFGGDGNDTLDGGTGTANTLIGGNGNDIYIVRAAGDSIVETATGGFDTVRTALASFVLPTNVEALVYTGTANFVGIGNAGNNILTGGPGSDFLYGLDGDDDLTGLQGDTLIGGAGNDTYRVNIDSLATIVEAVGGGVDTVIVGPGNLGGSYTLPANVENLLPAQQPFFPFAYAAPATIIGNALDNVITAGETTRLIYGMDGNDTIISSGIRETMVGGNGNDTFIATSGTTIRYLGGETGIDRITNAPLYRTVSAIELNQAYFLPTNVFSYFEGPGAVATGTNSAFVRDTNTNLVSYDADGIGPGAAVPLFYYDGTLTHDTFRFAFF